MTDRPLRALAQDLIREKALLFAQEEVPHAVAVLVEEWREGTPKTSAPGAVPAPGAKIYVRATIYVERESQKGILIGREGALLKKIGEIARRDIEKLAGRPVFLDLWVKLAKNWRKDPVMMRRLGF